MKTERNLFKNNVKETTITVFLTSDYSIFKYFLGNRDIMMSKAAVSKMKMSIKNNGWYKDSLIDVIHGMFVVDGQTRIEALKQIQKEGGGTHEIMYRVRKNVPLEQIIRENSERNNWKTKDYISSHIKQGNEQYKIFANMMKKYGLTYTALISIIYKTQCPAQMRDNFRIGGLHVYDWDRVEHCSNDLAMVRQIFKPARTHWFVQPFIKFWHHHNFDANSFIGKLRLMNSGLKPDAPDCASYAKLINKIYNFKRKDKVNFSTILMTYMAY